jgi:hypothetical protein
VCWYSCVIRCIKLTCMKLVPRGNIVLARPSTLYVHYIVICKISQMRDLQIDEDEKLIGR